MDWLETTHGALAASADGKEVGSPAVTVLRRALRAWHGTAKLMMVLVESEVAWSSEDARGSELGPTDNGGRIRVQRVRALESERGSE
jgi:hypothetical protein